MVDSFTDETGFLSASPGATPQKTKEKKVLTPSVVSSPAVGSPKASLHSKESPVIAVSSSSTVPVGALPKAAPLEKTKEGDKKKEKKEKKDKAKDKPKKEESTKVKKTIGKKKS